MKITSLIFWAELWYANSELGARYLRNIYFDVFKRIFSNKTQFRKHSVSLKEKICLSNTLWYVFSVISLFTWSRKIDLANRISLTNMNRYNRMFGTFTTFKVGGASFKHLKVMTWSFAVLLSKCLDNAIMNAYRYYFRRIGEPIQNHSRLLEKQIFIGHIGANVTKGILI